MMNMTRCRAEWVGVDELNRIAFVRRRVPGGERVKVYHVTRASLARLRRVAVTDKWIRERDGWGFAFTRWQGKRIWAR
jgi:hypothetical protein